MKKFTKLAAVALCLALALPLCACGQDQESEPGKSATEVAQEMKVDIDLTSMEQNEAYDVVYNGNLEPGGDLEGKVIKIKGEFAANLSEATNQYYFNVLVFNENEASVGFEFIWGDGSHMYPDSYPAEGDEITVIGTYETYTEEGDSKTYCRLNNAILLK